MFNKIQWLDVSIFIHSVRLFIETYFSPTLQINTTIIYISILLCSFSGKQRPYYLEVSLPRSKSIPVSVQVVFEENIQKQSRAFFACMPSALTQENYFPGAEIAQSRIGTVGIATGYGQDDQEVEVQILVWSRIFTSSNRPDRF
jgi:hypothetical protein